MATKKRILVVEDEDAIREFVVINLTRAGYEVTDVASGEQALEVYDSADQNFSIALLDIMMPGMDGFALCKELRKRSTELGIIMLTAKAQEMDKVNGFMLGADDYVVKPFSPSELVARVDAMYRRVAMSRTAGISMTPQNIEQGPFLINTKSRTAFKNGVQIDLTQVEFQLLNMLMSNPGVAFSRREILSKIWGRSGENEEKIVDVNVRRVRLKIEDDPSNPKYLVTVWGYGYRWDA